MTKINLLPWRQELREIRKQRCFAMMGASALTGLVIMLAVHLFLGGKIQQQGNRNMRLRQEIEALDKKIIEIKRLKEVKSGLLARMQIIERLQANRPMIVRLFFEINRVLPAGVHLDRVIRMGDFIVINGLAESNTNISNMMREIEKSKWLEQPSLREIENKKKDKYFKFSMQFKLHNPDLKDLLE